MFNEVYTLCLIKSQAHMIISYIRTQAPAIMINPNKPHKRLFRIYKSTLRHLLLSIRLFKFVIPWSKFLIMGQQFQGGKKTLLESFKSQTLRSSLQNNVREELDCRLEELAWCVSGRSGQVSSGQDEPGQRKPLRRGCCTPYSKDDDLGFHLQCSQALLKHMTYS